MTYAAFTAQINELYIQLEAANHSVSYCAHMMEMEPSDKSISEYEKALDYATKVRKAIREVNEEELARRSTDAYLKLNAIKKIEEEASSIDWAFIRGRELEKATRVN